VVAGSKESWSLVSAGNYKTDEHKRWSQVILRQSGNNAAYSLDSIKFPIQAIAIDSLGKKIAIAHEKSVRFWYCFGNKEDHLVTVQSGDGQIIAGIDFNNSGDKLIVCHNHGKICLIDCGEKPQILKSISIDMPIDRIHYADSQKVLYSVVDGKVMVLDMYDFFEQQSGSMRTHFFDDNDSSQCECISFDQAHNVGFIGWTQKSYVSDKIRKIIQVKKRIKDNVMQTILLSADGLKDDYYYSSYEGAFKKGNYFFVQCALFNDRIVAVGTDGNLYVWQVSSPELLCHHFHKKEQHEIIINTPVKKITQGLLQELQEEKQRSPRNDCEDSPKQKINEKKPISSRILLLKKTRTADSRSSSPDRYEDL